MPKAMKQTRRTPDPKDERREGYKLGCRVRALLGAAKSLLTDRAYDQSDAWGVLHG
jgi:hypothetical protein